MKVFIASGLRSYDPNPLFCCFLSTRARVLPPSVISMGGAASKLVEARGMEVMPGGHGWFASPDEYGLLL